METKRRTREQPPVRDATSEELAMLGMRIRKAVSEGYRTGNEYTGHNYGLDGHLQSYERVPLPSHISQPPSLMGAGSTVDSSSSLSEWGTKFEALQPKLQVIGEVENRKRKPEEAPDLGTYQQRYGELAFNEDF